MIITRWIEAKILMYVKQSGIEENRLILMRILKMTLKMILIMTLIMTLKRILKMIWKTKKLLLPTPSPSTLLRMWKKRKRVALIRMKWICNGFVFLFVFIFKQNNRTIKKYFQLILNIHLDSLDNRRSLWGSALNTFDRCFD